MVAKQVKSKVAVEQVSGPVEQTPPQAVAVIEATSLVPALREQDQRTKNLFVKVDTFNTEGREIGTRIVDMYHFGTRNWLQNHHWWAMHNGHTVEARTADQDEIGAYVAAQKLALADKFNNEKAHVAV